MDIIISFFRDVLDGPLYIAVVIISVILICAGIGYFAEKSQLRKKKEEELQKSYVSVSDPRTQNSDDNSQNNIAESVPGNMVNGNVQSAVTQMPGTNISNNNSVPNSNVVQSPVQNVAVNNGLNNMNGNQNNQ